MFTAQRRDAVQRGMDGANGRMKPEDEVEDMEPGVRRVDGRERLRRVQASDQGENALVPFQRGQRRGHALPGKQRGLAACPRSRADVHSLDLSSAMVILHRAGGVAGRDRDRLGELLNRQPEHQAGADRGTENAEHLRAVPAQLLHRGCRRRAEHGHYLGAGDHRGDHIGAGPSLALGESEHAGHDARAWVPGQLVRVVVLAGVAEGAVGVGRIGHARPGASPNDGALRCSSGRGHQPGDRRHVRQRRPAQLQAELVHDQTLGDGDGLGRHACDGRRGRGAGQPRGEWFIPHARSFR